MQNLENNPINYVKKLSKMKVEFIDFKEKYIEEKVKY